MDPTGDVIYPLSPAFFSTVASPKCQILSNDLIYTMRYHEIFEALITYHACLKGFEVWTISLPNRRTDPTRLAATQDPLRYTFINIIHGLVEVGQMMSDERVQGKGSARISQRIHLCLLLLAKTNLGCQHIRCSAAPSRCKKETDMCGGWPSFPFLRGWLNKQWKIRKQKRCWNYQTQNQGRKCHPVLRIESFKVSKHSPRKIASQSRHAKA